MENKKTLVEKNHNPQYNTDVGEKSARIAPEPVSKDKTEDKEPEDVNSTKTFSDSGSLNQTLGEKNHSPIDNSIKNLKEIGLIPNKEETLAEKRKLIYVRITKGEEIEAQLILPIEKGYIKIITKWLEETYGK